MGTLEMAKAVCTKDATYLIINTFDCFKAFPTPVPFATAEGTCQRFGGILAIVTDTHTIKELSGLLTSLVSYYFVHSMHFIYERNMSSQC